MRLQGASVNRLWVVVLFLAASLVFAVLEFYSPPFLPLWFFHRRARAEIAEGFAVVAVLLLLFQSKPALSRAMPSVARALARPVTISKNVRRTALVLFVAGTVVYSFMVFVDWAAGISFLHRFHNYIVSHYFYFHAFQSTGPAVGCVAFLAATFATLGLTIYHLDNGMASALKQALRTFTLPAILVLMVGLVVFWRASGMQEHVTFFAMWSLDGVYLISNYFVLIVSASLETMLLLWSGRRR